MAKTKTGAVDCGCDCPECQAGNCADCTNPACDSADCIGCTMAATRAAAAQVEGLAAETTSAETLAAPHADPLSPRTQIEHFAGAVAVMPDSFSITDRTVDVCWYSGIAVPRIDYMTGQPYDLILDMAGCRLERLNNGAPVYDSHVVDDVRDQPGVVVKAWADGPRGMATIRFDTDASGEALMGKVQRRIVQTLSFGTWIHKSKDVTPDGAARPMEMATDWEPFELSPIGVAADFNTEFLSAAVVEPPAAIQPNPPIQPPTSTATPQGTPIMTTEETAAETSRLNAITLAAVQDGMRAERVRSAGIRQIVALAALGTAGETLAAQLIDSGVTLEAARVTVFEQMAARATANPQAPAGAVTRDGSDTFRAQVEAGILMRANPSGVTAAQKEMGRGFAGLSLVEVARECLTAQGVNTRGLYPDAVAKAALLGPRGAPEFFEGAGMMTTSDFPGILANVANKFLRQGYEAAPKTFMPFCRQVSAKDFKPRASVQLSDIATLAKINEKGEFHRGSLTDNKETYSLSTYGEIIAITRKTIINDDLDALTRIPAGLGVAAANLESDTVWGVITLNANLADGVALFHATHKNLNASNALALAGLTAARAAMRVVKGPKGTYLNLTPKYLLAPAALEGTALQLLFPTQLAAAAVTAVVPTWVTNLSLIIEPRLDAVASVGVTNWFMVADPSQIDTIEYCYLEGQQGVYIETRYGFEVDGVEIRARLDFAAAAVEPRGLQKNTA